MTFTGVAYILVLIVVCEAHSGTNVQSWVESLMKNQTEFGASVNDHILTQLRTQLGTKSTDNSTFQVSHQYFFVVDANDPVLGKGIPIIPFQCVHLATVTSDSVGSVKGFASNSDINAKIQIRVLSFQSEKYEMDPTQTITAHDFLWKAFELNTENLLTLIMLSNRILPQPTIRELKLECGFQMGTKAYAQYSTNRQTFHVQYSIEFILLDFENIRTRCL